MPMLEGSPVDGSRGLCILLMLAIYLICQCAVNFTTFRDACQKDTRWAMIFNVINTIMSISLVIYVCVKVLQNADDNTTIAHNADSLNADSLNGLFA